MSKIRIGIGIAVVVVLVVVGVALLGGGDDDGDKPKSAQNKAAQSKDDDDKTSDASDSGDDGGSEPALRTVATNRASGANPTAQVASPLMRTPDEIWIRASAAPKQKVTVNWNLSCGVGATAQGSYDATPPDTRQIEIPGKKKPPKICIASTSSQLKGKGRIKVAILRDR